jgi:3-deoxy-7-phosphoheptulonate synthase
MHARGPAGPVAAHGLSGLNALRLFRLLFCQHVSAMPHRVHPATPSTRDTTRIDDLRIDAVRPLITPALLQEWLPTPAAAQTLVEDSRAAISRVLQGADDRLVVVVGPCSIHDHDQAMAYARLLKEQADALQDDLLVVMRVYFEKPRTTVGWKGYINDPHLDGSFAINEGLELARALLLDVLALGLPVGTEFLDLLSPQFISDLVSWGAIGARTTESQSHRQLASGLSCPVGFKNGTDGGVKVASDAIQAAQAPHAFMGMTKMGQAAIFETRGNRDCHVILRGGKQPNYSAADVDVTSAQLKAAGLREQVMIDVSHANSSKQHRRQIDVAAAVAQQVANGDARIMGVMIESHLQEGRQDIVPGQPLALGVSVTDACISFEQTVPVLQTLAAAVQARRQVRTPA